ncbi:MAG TPA: adenylate/guanylate cyclase domain-containing protein [Candidatus Limnocylindria bacterium]|nr:adenylate/guanylate cyclase domain-containing protein [Candidatus Limnocylindria bacterium]
MGTACPACGTQNAATAKFCNECGTSLVGATTGEATQAPSAESQIEPIAERRLVSVMFVDLVGFTSASEQRDAEDTRDLLSRYFELARETVGRHGGEIEKFIGDAVMAVWGTPTAHEDDAERAVRAALEMVSGVAGLEGGTALRARAGVLTGEAAVTIGAEAQGMVAGDMVNTASRLQSAAAAGTVLVGEATHRAASGAITFEEMEPLELKGKDQPVRAWRAVAVVGRRGGQGRASALEPPFVGRDEELRLLKDQFHATAREGKPRLVTIIGQAGIGKSRLAWELEKYLDGVVETVLWHEGRSPSYGEGISYWALAEIVRGRAGIAESEDADAARAKVAEMLAGLALEPAEQRWIEPRLTGLLGLDELPGEGREELFAAWRTFFERLAQQGTVMLVLWDLQWADQGLLDFVEHLLTWARTSPIFVVAEARPELLERRPGWGSNVRTATSVHLEPLSEADMRLLLTGIAPGMPEQALRAIIDRAEGVPLYAVETIRMLIDRGALVTDGSQLQLAGELPPLAVPETLHALIAARLDALGSEERSLVTDAAVLGLSFSVPALEGIGGITLEALNQHLDALVRRELLVLDVDPLSSERGQYRFIQGVVREVAYQSLAKRDRRAKHLSAARYFESLGEDELAGVLASHYLAAYRASHSGDEADALAAQARVALRAAAERATALHAPHGALEYLEQALEVTTDPIEQAALHERAAAAAGIAARLGVSDEHAQKAADLYLASGDRLGVLRSRTAQAFSKLHEHGDVAAGDILRAALADVADLPSAPEIVEAQSEIARVLMLQTSPESLVWCDRVLEKPNAATPRVLVNTLITKGSILMMLGRSLESEAILAGAVVLADRLGEPFAMLRARNNAAQILGSQSLASLLQMSREVYEIAERFGERTWIQQAIGTGLSAALEAGSWEDWQAEADAEQADAAGFYAGWFEAERARRLAFFGQTDEADAILQTALSDDSVRNSAQATAFMAVIETEIRIAQGRWVDAFEASRRAWDNNDSSRQVTQLAVLAAAAAGDSSRLAEAVAAQAAVTTEDLPLAHASRQIAACLTALLASRWDEARTSYLNARRLLEDIGAQTLLARLQLQLAQGAGEQFPEAAEAGRLAEAYFHERGADAFVATFRAKAAMPPAARSAPPIRSSEGALAEAESST